ncbi:MAG: hypothetical protein GF307_13020, partial [candidate division Zixibacteria bacterium]|nr:hypothetical protein [candidate division Zixibacteria bacterium]
MRVLHKIIFLCIIFTIGSIGLSQPVLSQETLSGSLNDFVNTLEDSTVGANARHALTFRNENLIPQRGKIHFDFQAGFDLSQIDGIQMGIIGYPGVDISSFDIDDQVVTINLNPEFPPVPANTSLWILLDRVINDTTSGAHTVVGWTTTQNDSLIDGPTLTRLFNLNPDILYRVGISPEADTSVSAGRYLTFEANGYDRYGNIIGGLLYNWFVNPDSCGFIDNGIFVGNKVGQCRVIVSYAGKADTSGVVSVVPGEIGTLHFIAVPEEGVAGWPLEDNVVLEILDIRENRKTNFEGNVHFTSTADSVDFLYDVDNPYYFTLGDQGFHIFSGSDFTIFNSDEHKIIAHHRGWYGESSNIFIEPDTLYTFDIEDVQDTVQAGQPFPVRVIDAEDRYGNPANGVVRVVGGPGIVPSPNGIRPELNDISISGGQGQANQRLFARGNVALELVSQFYNDTTNFFTVMPGEFHTMDLEISTPQISGVPFTGESIIRAKDMFWNTKTDMDASEDTVIIESTDGASMLNNVFDEEDDFIGGICDLTVEQTTYLGSSRWTAFIAYSPSIGDTANSNLIRFISPELEQFDIVNSTIFIGDSAEASIRISNPTDSVILIDSLFILNEYNEEMRARSIINLPDSLFPEGPRNYNMYFDVDIDAPPGPTGYSIKVYSSYLGNPVISSMPNFPDYAVVAAHKFIDTDGESLSPDSATIGYNYSFSIEVTDTFNAPISLDPDSSFFILQDSLSNQYRTNLNQPYYLIPGVANTIVFDSAYFNPVFTPGTYNPKLILRGDMDGYIYDDLLMIDYPVTILPPASLSYYPGSLRPDSAVTGSNVSFGIRMRNAGTAPVNLDIDSCSFSFSDGDENYTVSADTSVARRVDIFMPGDTTLYFMPNEVSNTFEPGVYYPDLRVFGYQNEILIDTLFALTGDSVSVITRGIVSIDTLYAEVPNSPYVNYGQVFDMMAIFKNLGMEPIEDIIIHLNSNSGSHYPDSLIAQRLDGNDSLIVSYPVQADSQSVWEQFQVEVSSATGAVSGEQAEVRSTSGNNALLRKQEPAEVNITDFGVPADTGEVFEISAGRQFNAEALVSKFGESDVDGEMRLELDFSGAPGFSVTDSISRDFNFDEPARWRLIAASDTGMFEISIRIAGEIYDLNDNLSALGPDSIASFGVHVVPGSHLVSDLSIISPVGALDGVLSSGQSFVIRDTVSIIGEIDDV